MVPTGRLHWDPALTDVLLPLQNRRAFDQDCPALLEAARTRAEPLALAMFDVDHFKQVNDRHGGHATGDEALIAIAELVLGAVRGKGVAYRYGGDELAIMLPNHSMAEALAVAERVRLAVNAHRITSRSLTVSASLGVAVFPDHAVDVETLKKAADSALYDAKDAGRNLVHQARARQPVNPSARRSLDDRLLIGSVIGSRHDVPGSGTHDLSLSLTNNGDADSFAVQVVEVGPIDATAPAVPWFVRWKDVSGEMTPIHKNVTRALHVCEMTLADKGRKIRFFTPTGAKETVVSATALNLTLKITGLRSGETIHRDLTIAFNAAMPEAFMLQPLRESA